MLNHWAECSTSWRSLLIFQFPSTVQVFESFWFQCVRVWPGNLPEIIFSLFGQGTSCSMEMRPRAEAGLHVPPASGPHRLWKVFLGLGWTRLGS